MIFERAFAEGELDSFDFTLAENLHMTVGQMQSVMDNREYVQWRSFYAYRQKMRDFEMKKARARGR